MRRKHSSVAAREVVAPPLIFASGSRRGLDEIGGGTLAMLRVNRAVTRTPRAELECSFGKSTMFHRRRLPVRRRPKAHRSDSDEVGRTIRDPEVRAKILRGWELSTSMQGLRSRTGKSLDLIARSELTRPAADR